MTKICTKCKEEKELDKHNFYVRTGSSDGFFNICKVCYIKKSKERDRSVYDRKYRYKYKYGITQEIYEEMYEAQNGCCAICGNWNISLSVDHCHKEGQVRGLLCQPCNMGLGFLRDSIPNLLNAVQYLSSGTVLTNST